jgi:MFS transporter, ACS family, pantothenate transporter
MAGTMFSGIMMTAIYTSLASHTSLAGWRWLFIILGLITLPVAIFGYVFFPDLPENTKAFWLTPEERELAVSRLPPKPPKAYGHQLGWNLFRRVLLRPELYVMSIMLSIVGC